MKRSRINNERPTSPPRIKKKIASNTTGKAIANFFAKPSEKEPEKLHWKVIEGGLLVGKYQATHQAPSGEAKRRKLAAFDFDWTLAKTSSGNLFSRSAEDWQWWDSSVPIKLKELDQDGYQIVVLSNQAVLTLSQDPRSKSLGDGKRLSDFKAKIGYVFNQLDLNISIYAATLRNEFRKPRTGMWTRMLADYGLQGAGEVDLAASIYIGDAGGRQATSDGIKADHACSDRDFAANVGIAFSTPEEFFLGEPQRPFQRGFDFAEFLQPADIQTTDDRSIIFGKKHDQELVLLCGSPGAGKSTFYHTILQPLGYKRVNQDILKSRDRCIKVAMEHLASGESVAVDNTNADPDVRRHWIKLAKEHNIPIRVVHLATPAAICRHNDAVRAGHTSTLKRSSDEMKSLEEELMTAFNPERRTLLPSVAFTSYNSRFVVPDIQEGFSEVITIPFVFKGSEEARKVWGRYWI